jgi:hypothetical protein
MMEDYTTNTLDGAKGFAEVNEEDNPMLPNFYDDDDMYAEEAFDNNNFYEEDDEECDCSDPGCPCRGNKIGGL